MALSARVTRSFLRPRPQTTPSNPKSVSLPGDHGSLVKTLRILVLAAAGMAALLSLLPAAGHDQLWFLLMAERWLHGAALYGPQNFDSNPPLIVWLSALPVLLSEHLRLPETAIGKLLVLLAAALSATLSLYLLRRISPLTRTQVWWLTLACLCIFTIVPARDLGQRDHLTAILCLPYVLAAALDDRDHTGAATPTQTLLLQITTGLLAAIGICLKPHQAFIPIAVEVTLLIRSSITARSPVPSFLRSLNPRRRPEPAVIVLSGLVFLLLIHHFTPAYLTLALPTLRDTYWAIGHLTPVQLLAESPQLHILAAIAIALYLVTRTSPAPLRRSTALLLAAGIAATAAYYIQGTGWYYQQLPAISLFACALALQLLDPPARLRLPNSPWLPHAAAALSILALALTTHFTGYPFTPDRSFAITSPDPVFFRDLPFGTPVAIITTSVDDTMMPITRYHLLWSQRTNNVWTLPAILRAESAQTPQDPARRPHKHLIPPNHLSALEQQQHVWMSEDLTRWHPQLILVARCQAPDVHCQELEDRHDDLLAWFARDPAFRAICQHYRYLGTSGMYDAYTRTTENW